MPLIREYLGYRWYSDGPNFGRWVDNVEDADWFTDHQASILFRALGQKAPTGTSDVRDPVARIIPDDQAIEVIETRKADLLESVRSLDAMHMTIVDHRNSVMPDSDEARVHRAFSVWFSGDTFEKIWRHTDAEIAELIRPLMVEATNPWIETVIAKIRAEHEKGQI